MSSVKRSIRHICECFTALFAAVSLTFNGIDCSFYLIFTEANDISGLTMGAGVAVFVFLFDTSVNTDSVSPALPNEFVKNSFNRCWSLWLRFLIWLIMSANAIKTHSLSVILVHYRTTAVRSNQITTLFFNKAYYVNNFNFTSFHFNNCSMICC